MSSRTVCVRASSPPGSSQLGTEAVRAARPQRRPDAASSLARRAALPSPQRGCARAALRGLRCSARDVTQRLMGALAALLLASLGARLSSGAPFHVPGSSAGEQLLLREGQKALAQYSERAAAETPGALQRLAGKRGCWTAAVVTLTAECGRLDDDGARRLALAIANCQLEASGERTYPCAPAKAFKDCTRGMSEKAWTSYSAAQGQATAICFYLTAESFMAESQDSVNRLTEASTRATGALDTLSSGLASSLALQAKLSESQGAVTEGLAAVRDSQTSLEQLQLSALDGQQQLLDGQTALAESAAAAASTLDAVASATAEANQQLNVLFDAHREAARATLQRLNALGEGAAALEAAQARLGASQGELLEASTSVAERQRALAGALDAIGTTMTQLAFWQQRLARGLSLVLGAGFTLDDIAWTAGTLGAASAATSIAHTAAARPALMLALAGSACAERALVPWLVMSTAAARAALAAGDAVAQRGGIAAIAAGDALSAFAARLERAEVKYGIRYSTLAICALLLARAAHRHAGAAKRAAIQQAQMEQRLQRSLTDALAEHKQRLFEALREEIAASAAFRRAMEPNSIEDAYAPPPLPPLQRQPAATPALMTLTLTTRVPAAPAPPRGEAAAVHAPAAPASVGAMLVTPPQFAHAAAGEANITGGGEEPAAEMTARARLDSVLEHAAAHSHEAPPEAAPPASRDASRAEAVAHQPAAAELKRKRSGQHQPAAASPAKRATRARSGQCSGADA